MFTESDLHELLQFTADVPVLSIYLNTNPAEGNADAYRLHLRNMLKRVNLPEDKTALRELAREVAGLGAADYRRWFAGLPERVQGEMVSGPLGRLHAEVLEAERAGERSLGRKRVESAMKELHHLAEGADHPRRAEAIAPDRVRAAAVRPGQGVHPAARGGADAPAGHAVQGPRRGPHL